MTLESRVRDAIAALEAGLLEHEHGVDPDPPWMHTALGELGVSEIPGARHEPRILEYHAVTRGGGGDSDETPWCASFACWCLERAGRPHPASKAARSFQRWGVELEEPRRGCVVVLWRGSPSGWRGHVGFLHSGPSGGEVALLGGNQGNAVSVQGYPIDRVLSYRWPVPGGDA